MNNLITENVEMIQRCQ